MATSNSWIFTLVAACTVFTAQNRAKSKFWAAPTNPGGMPFREHPLKLFSTQNTPLHEPTCQPLTIHYTLTFYTISCFFHCLCLWESGKGRERKNKKVPPKYWSILPSEKGYNKHKEREEYNITLPQTSRALTSSQSVVVESQNIFCGQPCVSGEYSPLTVLHEFQIHLSIFV